MHAYYRRRHFPKEDNTMGGSCENQTVSERFQGEDPQTLPEHAHEQDGMFTRMALPSLATLAILVVTERHIVGLDVLDPDTHHYPKRW